MIPLKNTSERYGLGAVAIHWLMAIMIIALLAVGLYMTDLPSGEDKFRIYGLHKAFGAMVLFLAVFRVLWRAKNTQPNDPENMPVLQKKMAHDAHKILYLLMFAMPLSGWAMSSAAGYPVSVFGLFNLPDLVSPDKELREIFGEAHELLANLLMAILAVHMVAALLHHFYYKDNVLKKMLPFRDN